LIGAPTTGRLGAGGLDVFSRESVGADDPLLKLPNVAWLTAETLEHSPVVIAENCRRLRAGEALLHRVV
jgi:phosphoglycerate dehydrogenase-like enzyme